MKCYDALDKFLYHQKIKNNTQQTIDYYRKRIGYFITFVNNKNIKKLSSSDYNRYTLYLLSKNISDATIKTSLTAVRVFLNFLYHKKFIKIDIVSELENFKCTKKTIVILSQEQIKEIYQHYKEDEFYGARNLLLISLMLDCGLRVSEVINLRLKDINIDFRSIKIFGKGRKERIVPLSDVTLYYLNNYLKFPQVFDYLAVNIASIRLTSSAIRRLLLNLRDDLNYSTLYPHYLRHSFATWFLINGGDPLSLQTILGHETLYMTEIYVHIANQILISMNSKYSPLSNINYFIKKRIP